MIQNSKNGKYYVSVLYVQNIDISKITFSIIEIDLRIHYPLSQLCNICGYQNKFSVRK